MKKINKLDLSEEKLYGMDKWIHEYQQDRPTRESLLVSIEKQMQIFDEAEKEKQFKDENPVVDDDGFTLVTSKNKASQSKAFLERRKQMRERKAEKKRRKIENGDETPFYRFQKRDAKKQALLDLRKRFEHDKAVVAKMKMI